MDEEELREKIANSIVPAILDYFMCRKNMVNACHDVVDQILSLIKEAGYKSPEEISHHERERLELFLSFIPDGWEMPLGFDNLIYQFKEGEPK